MDPTPDLGRTGGVPARNATLAIVSLSTALVLVVFTVPLTTLASTARGLGAGPGAQAWLLSAMSLGCAIGLLPAGAIGDDFGRRRVFAGGLALMALTLALGAAAPSAPILDLLRVLQGIGGAAVMACGLGLLAQAYPDPAGRSHATAVWAAGLGAGVASGPILAAVVDAVAGWRSVYAVEASPAAALAFAASRWLKDSRAERPRPPDVSGALALGAGVAALLAGLTEARADPARPAVFALVVGGAAMLAAFVAVERRKPQPMLDLTLFRRGDFTGALVGAFASGAGVLAIMSLLPTVLMRGFGLPPVGGAVALLAWSATSSLTALAARRLPRWATPPRVIVAGLAACAAGQLGIGFVASGAGIARFLPGMLLAGAANGLLNAALGAQAIASVPAARAAMGSGANNTARYLGSAFGLTVAAIVIGHATDASSAALLHAWTIAVVLSATFSATGAVFVGGLAIRGAVVVVHRVR